MKYTLLAFALLLFSTVGFAQKERSHIREGNKEYKGKNYGNAIVSYNKALSIDSSSYPAQYNLASAYYKTEKYDKAAAALEKLKGKPANRADAAKMYHNMGNTYMKQQKYQESVDAYKNALKNNPNDDDTRYNLAYAMEKLKQQQQQNKDKKDNKDNKDKKDNKDNKDKKDGKDNKDNKKDDDKEGKDDQDKKDTKQGEQKQPKYSKEEAQRYLDALKNDEKNVQDKVQKKKANQQKVSIEKDW